MNVNTIIPSISELIIVNLVITNLGYILSSFVIIEIRTSYFMKLVIDTPNNIGIGSPFKLADTSDR